MLSNFYLRIREAFVRAEQGQGLVEYSLILILIAIAVIVVVSVLGKTTENIFSNVSHGL